MYATSMYGMATKDGFSVDIPTGDNVEFRELLHQFCQSKIKNTSPEKSICKMAGCYISTGQ
jgi:hypothetical protein